MKTNHPQWLETINKNWLFYSKNFSTSLYLVYISLMLIAAAVYFNSPINVSKIGDYLFSFGYSLLLIGIFSIIYEVRTREAFLKMLAGVNPNIESGVTVHPSHKNVISREDAIEKYVRRKDVIRIRTSTADNYVQNGNLAKQALEMKVLDENCELQILLYLPVFQDGLVTVGQHGEQPINIIRRQVALLDSYNAIINSAPTRVVIKFFFSPLYINFIMLGNDRMFSSLIPNLAKSGISTPCFEIFPTGSKSLFFQFQHEFDSIFHAIDPHVSLSFELVEPLLRTFNGDVATFKACILALADQR